jgi:predicted transposase YdaD
MGSKDILSKTLFKNLVRDFALYLFGLPVTEVELLETANQRIEDRHADLVGKVIVPGEPPFLLHIEIQNDNDRLMPVRMLRYLSDLLMRFPHMPVRQYVVYIGKPALTMQEGFDQPDFTYRYRLLDMHQVDCEDLLRQDSPDAWVLAILCDFHTRNPSEVVQTILARLAERLRDHPARLREYVSMLDTLASNRNLNVNIHEALNMLNIDIEKLATYQIGMEKGLEQGIVKGIQQGVRLHAVETAKRLLAMNLEPSQVATITELPLSEIEGLRGSPGNE